MQLKFDRKEFNRGFGLPFRIIRAICVPGLAVTILTVLYVLASEVFGHSNEFPLPHWLIPTFIACTVNSITTYPIVCIAHYIYHEMLSDAELTVGKKGLRYRVLSTIYEAQRLSEVRKTRMYYICYGEAVKTVISKQADRKVITRETVVKIPRAFKNMEKLRGL